MKIDKNVRTAKFVKRPNRFQGYVDIDGTEEMVHVPNTGRCREILKEGATVLIRAEDNPNRKTRYSLIAAYKGKRLINIDSQAPNKIAEEALKNEVIEDLKEYRYIRREKTFGNSRFDFKLCIERQDEDELIALEDNRETRFPDAPTERGTKHLLELIEVKKSGRGAGVLFVIQMDDIDYFRPNDEMDPEFGKALRSAKENGVDIFAYCCKVEMNEIALYKRIPVKL